MSFKESLKCSFMIMDMLLYTHEIMEDLYRDWGSL